MLQGTVKSYNAVMRSGFITPDTVGRDVMFLDTAVQGDPRNIQIGQRVRYELYPGEGEPEAERVVLTQTFVPQSATRSFG